MYSPSDSIVIGGTYAYGQYTTLRRKEEGPHISVQPLALVH